MVTAGWSPIILLNNLEHTGHPPTRKTDLNQMCVVLSLSNSTLTQWNKPCLCIIDEDTGLESLLCLFKKIQSDSYFDSVFIGDCLPRFGCLCVPTPSPPPRKCTCWKPNPWCDGVGRRGLWEVIRSWEWSLVNGISALAKRFHRAT